MSMYRQLLTAIVLSSVLALVGSLISSTVSTRSYLIEQLRVKNQDNASALALTLSQTENDPVKVELAVAAQFDSGNYKLVRFTDASGRVALEKLAPEAVTDVPAWFVALVPMDVPAGNAKVTSGWRQLGMVTLVSHSVYAYQSLWESTLRMSLAMLIACLIGCGLGAMILRRIKRPLDLVVDQAIAITEKRFITISEPKVPELRRLASAMNMTVKRLKEMFEDEARRLEAARREANSDTLTGLPNRDFFITQIREALHSEETAFGACMFLRIARLADINNKHGRVVTDEIIRRIARHIHAYSEQMDGSLTGRLNGSDFALVIPSEDPQSVAQALMRDVVRDIAQYCADGFCASIGIASYHKGLALPDLLGQIDMALAEAESKADNAVCMASSNDPLVTPKTMDGWAQLLHAAITQRRMYLLSFPVASFKGGQLHREGPLRLRESDDALWIPAGKFLPVAERLGLTSVLDLAAVELGLKAIEKDADHVGYAVNLSASSLKTSIFLPALRKLIQTHHNAAQRLWLELPEAGVLKHFDEFRELCLTLKQMGVRLGIEHFGRHFDQIGLLHDLGLDFVKVDASFVRAVDKNPANQSFLKGLVGIVHGIGMLVIAEGVLTSEEMQTLEALGFDGATGPAIKD